MNYSPREKCPYLELFWSVFSHIPTKYGEIRSVSPYTVRMRENRNQNNSEYGQLLRSDFLLKQSHMEKRKCLVVYTQTAFTCLKLTIKTLEQVVTYVQS